MAGVLTNLVDREVAVAIERQAVLRGTLNMPVHPTGIIIFAHGSGSSRLSPRNRYVAEVLQKKGFATLLFDLLTEDEEAADVLTGEFRFDIPLLTSRLLLATKWCRNDRDCRQLPIGYFGASTGAAAALCAAAEVGPLVRAVVSRGGRADMAIDDLPRVTAPTLLIVGGNDATVIDMNRHAAEYLAAKHELLIVPRAGHLFEEPGALEKVALAATDWFESHLAFTVGAQQ